MSDTVTLPEEKTKERPTRDAVPGKKLTNLQKIKLIEETMEREIRPSLKQDDRAAPLSGEPHRW